MVMQRFHNINTMGKQDFPQFFPRHLAIDAPEPRWPATSLLGIEPGRAGSTAARTLPN